MSKADAYNHAELVAGRLTLAHITELVSLYQLSEDYPVVEQDGMFGPKTRAGLEQWMLRHAIPGDKFLANPLPFVGPDARQAQITSGHHSVNPDRPDHNGCDFFYRWQPGDQPNFVGDKGGATKQKDGTPKWVVPYGVHALAAASGKVQIAGNSPTGYRLWIDHGNGWRTGYFHLLDLKVAVGQEVAVGQPLGLVGDNPQDHDGRHLHFELSPVDRYAPVNPEPYFK
jgi:murein DD-endopeptidase MepM/ murein hydrolase activator NlpD